MQDIIKIGRTAVGYFVSRYHRPRVTWPTAFHLWRSDGWRPKFWAILSGCCWLHQISICKPRFCSTLNPRTGASLYRSREDLPHLPWHAHRSMVVGDAGTSLPVWCVVNHADYLHRSTLKAINPVPQLCRSSSHQIKLKLPHSATRPPIQSISRLATSQSPSAEALSRGPNSSGVLTNHKFRDIRNIDYFIIRLILFGSQGSCLVS